MNSKCKAIPWLRAVAATGVVIAIVGCNGGGSQAGISGTGIATGAITGFGSIFVNGVEFDTDKAQVTVNGQTATPGDLRAGMVVDVDGSIDGDSGNADAIDFNSDILGTVAKLDRAAGTFTALGQQVAIDGRTVSDHVNPGTLAKGDVVEISGFRDSAGVLHASRVDKQSTAPAQSKVVGTVSNLDAAAHSFSINALSVDYSGAMVNGFGAGAPANGDRVEARGTLDDSDSPLLHATEIDKEQAPSVGANDVLLLLQGFAENVAGDRSRFQLGNTTVLVTGNTTFDGGSKADLIDGARLRVTGRAKAAGLVSAAHIKFLPKVNARIEADVQTVEAHVRAFTVLNNITVHITRDTECVDNRITPTAVNQMRCSDLHSGDHVLVQATATSSGITAVQIRRLTPPQPDRTEVGGVLGTKNADCSVLGILGVTVDTDAATTFNRANVGETRPMFCDHVMPGSSIVDARGGPFTGGSFTADSVQDGRLGWLDERVR